MLLTLIFVLFLWLEICEAKHLVEAVKLESIMVGKGIQLKGPYV